MRKKIEKAAIEDLRKECKEKKKTTNLVYTTLKTQGYLLHMYPKQARIICQARSKSLDIKEHRSYKYTDLSCRKCQTYDETLTHVINCGKNTYITVDITWKMTT